MPSLQSSKRKAIDAFVSQRTIALFGLSRTGKKFGNSVFRELTKKGYRIHPIHPHLTEIDGVRCYPNLAAIPESVGGVLLIIPPAQVESVIEDILDAGIRNIWMQQGSESEKAISLCHERGAQVVAGECIFMFVEPVKGVHRFHRWLNSLFGKMPPTE